MERWSSARGGIGRSRARRLACACSVAVLALLGSAGGASAALFSRAPGEMFHGRYTPAAGLLPGGKVLIAGGFDQTAALATAEIYDPATGKFEQLGSEMKVAHGEQATVTLPDGHVLLIGGWSSVTESLKTAELYDPVLRTFEKVGPEMTIARDGPGAVLLPGGKVFITGGAQDSGPYTKTAELYDPATGTFAAVKGTALEGRYQPSVALLPNGKVLIAGGYSGESAFEYLKTAEIYDPATDTFTKLEGSGHEPLETRDEAGVVTLQNGKVLIAGGYNGKELASAEVFDYTTNTFTKLTDVLLEPRSGNTGVLLPDGRALFVAGYDSAALTAEARYLRSIEITSVPAATPTTGAASGVGITTANISGTVLTEARASVSFQFGTSTAYGSATPAQTIGFTASPQGLGASLSGLAPSTTYHFRVIATNAGGTTFGADQTFTTAPPVPALASVKQLRSRWREGNGLAQISRRRRVPVGTSFSFALNTPAKVTLAFTQRVGGRKVHGRCVAQTRRNRRARHCSRTVTRGTLVVNGHAGTNTVKFQGRLSRSKKLRPGTYTLVITANGPSGASASQKLTFTIVR